MFFENINVRILCYLVKFLGYGIKNYKDFLGFFKVEFIKSYLLNV